MTRDGTRTELTKAAKVGSKVVNKKRLEDRKRKEQELLEKAVDLAIAMYGPALKELEKH